MEKNCGGSAGLLQSTTGVTASIPLDVAKEERRNRGVQEGGAEESGAAAAELDNNNNYSFIQLKKDIFLKKNWIR